MGAEHSRVQSTARGAGGVSWQHVAVGFQYSATDVAVWPQCLPLLLWFTEQDANVLYQRLLRRTRTRFLTIHEFRAWLSNDADATSVLHPSGLPVVPNDILTPPSLLQQNVLQPKRLPQCSALLMLDLYVEHLFTTFARGGTKVFAMEFLAAMVLGSHAIWSVAHKCRVLLTLFQDPANASSPKEPIFKEADLAQLFLCVMQGACKLTVGVQRLWRRHALDVPALARQFAADGARFALSAREREGRSENVLLSTKVAVSASEVRRYVDATPACQRFVALFSGEEMRNPFTFGLARSPCDGLVLPRDYRASLASQRQQYETLLAQYVSPEGRAARRRESAAMLIQSTWRRRCSRGLLERKRAAQQRQRHASAALLQHFLRQWQLAKVLEQHAEAETHARNGGVLMAGEGPCLPSADASALAPPPPLRLVEAFKLLHVKICAVALSRSCALALPSDRATLFCWGRRLPRVYEDAAADEISLSQHEPARLAFRFAAPSLVAQVACGLSHALVVTDDGNVHSWGFNDHGQLGHGSAATLQARALGERQYAAYVDERDAREYEYLAQPTALVYFQGSPSQQAAPIPVQHVVCGDYYSLALSRDGDVFSWGEASEGQLGHSDAHTRFEVAFVDRHMLNSAFTFLPEPEPVLALSEQRVVVVACRKNHSVALTADGRVFEWGNWGKRCGHDREHAFAPVEKAGVAPLRLRQLSVGDHHTLAEGASVWLTLAGRVDGLRAFLACSPAWSCSQDAVETCYVGKDWVCVLADCDVDDIEEDEDEDEGQPDESGSLWRKRVAPFRLREPALVATYDAKLAHVVGCFRSLARTFQLEKMLMLWFHGHVLNRLVAMPCGKPPGVYLQILLPRDDSQRDAELEAPHAAELPPMAEFPVVAGSTASGTTTRTGWATHVFHAAMRERLAPLSRRVRKSLPTDFLEPNSLTVVVVGESEADGQPTLAWGELVVEAMARRVLAAQEAGALAVLLVLDLPGADAFELALPPDAGVYVPVVMVTMATQATWSPEPHGLTMRELLERFVAAQAFDETERWDDAPTVPPAWMARCFERVDTTAARIQSALSHGAAGVVLIQDAQSVEGDGETRGAPVFLDAGSQPGTDRLVAMVSHSDGEALRAACRLSLTDRAMPFAKSDADGGAHCELLADVGVEIRPGGTVYAWGNGQNGRLGLGDPSRGPLLDGYEALTDSPYRYVDRATPVAALAGHEMRALVSGAAHNVAVTQTGRVFTWGKGARGELATAQSNEQARQDQWVPRALHQLRYDRVVAAAANDTATALVTELVEPEIYLERRKEVTQLRAAARKSSCFRKENL